MVKGMSEMSKTRNRTDGAPRDVGDVVSIVGPGMKVVGDCSSDGTIRIEGQVEGSVKAAKSVVIGKEGVVLGDVVTQDAIVAGRVNGSVSAESRVELQTTCRVQGDIRSRRIKLDEGGQVDGQLHMGGRGAEKPAEDSKHGEKPAGNAPGAVQVN
jgi:cytoskeletal protein CcmA (bactofilin family)